MLCCPGGAGAQDSAEAGYLGRGTARVEGGDVAAARQGALVDAQQKAVLEAVCTLLPVADVTRYFLTLSRLFFERPDLYLQRFKILKENALFEEYRVDIQGVVQMELLRQDLEALEVLKPERDKMRVLVMLAEADIDQPEREAAYWWSSVPERASSRFRVQQTLEKYFAEKGFSVINPLEVPYRMPSEEMGRNPAPGLDEVCLLASRLGARIVVTGQSSLKKVQSQKLASFESVQCDMNAAALNVNKKATVVQTATYALGIHIDEGSAAQDAVEKACRSISDQISDKIYLQMQAVHGLTFNLTFEKAAAEEEVKAFINAFREDFPEVEILEVRSAEEENHWTMSLESTVETATLLQKIFESGIGGYQAGVESVSEDVVELSVHPAEAPPPDALMPRAEAPAPRPDVLLPQAPPPAFRSEPLSFQE